MLWATTGSSLGPKSMQKNRCTSASNPAEWIQNQNSTHVRSWWFSELPAPLEKETRESSFPDLFPSDPCITSRVQIMLTKYKFTPEGTKSHLDMFWEKMRRKAQMQMFAVSITGVRLGSQVKTPTCVFLDPFRSSRKDTCLFRCLFLNARSQAHDCSGNLFSTVNSAIFKVNLGLSNSSHAITCLGLNDKIRDTNFHQQ